MFTTATAPSAMSLESAKLANDLPTCSSSEASCSIQTNHIPTFDISCSETISLADSYDDEEAQNRNHVCAKTSVNPFFNLLRLYRLLPDGKGKSACQSAIEGAEIWREMTAEEKDPFQKVAHKESRRRFYSRRKKQMTDERKQSTMKYAKTPKVRDK